MMNRTSLIFVLLIFGGCASLSRGCSSCSAKHLGADWVVVELTETDARPYRCFTPTGVSLTSETGSDGIWWKDTDTGNLIHVSGSYDYVQVNGNKWDMAFKTLGISQDTCDVISSRMFDPYQGKYYIMMGSEKKYLEW